MNTEAWLASLSRSGARGCQAQLPIIHVSDIVALVICISPYCKALTIRGAKKLIPITHLVHSNCESRVTWAVHLHLHTDNLV
jgi:hypothetical protein